MRRRGTGHEDAVLDLWRSCRADRTAVDARGNNGRVEPTVKPRIARQQRPIAGLASEIDLHTFEHKVRGLVLLAVFGLVGFFVAVLAGGNTNAHTQT